MSNHSVIAGADAIPTIDISALFGPDGHGRSETDARIMAAAGGGGFLVATGLPDDCLDPILRRRMLTIFSLADHEKRGLCRATTEPSNPNVYRGWFPLRSGHATHKEGIDIGPDVAHQTHRVDPSDPLTESTPLPDPARLPGWSEAIADYYLAMERTGEALMRSIARGLGMKEDTFDRAFRNGISTLRLARYPVRRGETFDGEGASLRVDHDGGEWHLLGAPHADSGFITLVAQDGVEGLQAQSHDGLWTTVPPTEGAVAVNFGSLLERWTGGRIRATRHRVIGRNEERFSIPFFYEPAVDAVIAPIPALGGTPFEPFPYGDHLWTATTTFVEQAGIAHLRKPRGLLSPIGRSRAAQT